MACRSATDKRYRCNPMLETLQHIDDNILLAVNGWHCEFFDHFMRVCSDNLIWAPLYFAIILLFCHRFSTKYVLLLVLAIIVMITLSDQLSVNLRHLIGRLRPAYPGNPFSQMLHIVGDYRIGQYGCPSSHAANSAAITFFCWFVFRQRILSLVMKCWMILVCYSRMYLGVHYFTDLLAGFLFGFIMAALTYYVLIVVARRLKISTDFISKPKPHSDFVLPLSACLLVLLFLSAFAAYQTWC